MRTFTTEHTVYTFDELSDEAKQKVVSDFYDINTSHEWWDGDIDWFNEDIFALYGLEVGDVNFDLDRGSWCDFNSVTILDEHKLLKSVGADLRTKRARDVLDYGVSADKVQFGAGEFRTEFYTGTGDFAVEIDNLWRGLTSECLKRLRDEYECYTSEEAIIETIQANDYEFYADGRMA